MLLTLLGVEEGDIAAWSVYRKSQDQASYLSYLPVNPFRKEFVDPEFSTWFSKLAEPLDLKIRFLQVKLQEELKPGESSGQLMNDMTKLEKITREFDRSQQVLSQLTEHDNVLEYQRKQDEVAGMVKELIAISQKVNWLQGRIVSVEPTMSKTMSKTIGQIHDVLALIQQMELQHRTIESLAVALSMYSDEFLQLKWDIKTALDGQKVDIQHIFEEARSLLENYNSALNRQLEKVTFNEQQATVDKNERELTEITSLLEKQELVESLAQRLQSSSDQAAFFKQKNKERDLKVRVNAALTHRINDRTVNVQALKTSFDQEWSSCLKKEQPKVQIINLLKRHLDEYEKSGDSKDAIAYLKATVQQFEGQDFQAMLYKSLSTLMDLDCQIPEDYYLPPDEAISHEAACQVLQGSPKKYAESINGLYRHITHITNYGQSLAKDCHQDGLAVQRLANNLEHDVDRFVIKNKNATDNQKTANFHQFKAHFTYRMHSEDNVMRRHSNFWIPLIANLVFGLLTAGTALGVKFIYSLVVERRASPLFFDRTEAQQSIASMSHTVDDLLIKTSMTTFV